jgi:hypothetical protein
MSRDNVELVKRLQPPSGSELTALFRDDSAWARSAKRSSRSSKNAAGSYGQRGARGPNEKVSTGFAKPGSTGICEVRDGKITRVEYYASRAEAFEAAGLAEEVTVSRSG